MKLVKTSSALIKLSCDPPKETTGKELELWRRQRLGDGSEHAVHLSGVGAVGG